MLRAWGTCPESLELPGERLAEALDHWLDEAIAVGYAWEPADGMPDLTLPATELSCKFKPMVLGN